MADAKNRKTESTGNNREAGQGIKELFESEKYKTYLITHVNPILQLLTTPHVNRNAKA